MARRGRNLTPEDRQLWEQIAATATPLDPRRAIPGPAAAPRVDPAPTPPSARPAAPAGPPARAAAGARVLERAHPHMDRRRFDKLRRGRLEPEARLDLHGMSSERAHAALTRFILDADARELRLLLVITGKGRADEAGLSPRRHGILRHSLPHWLAAPPLNARVLEVATAHQRHGGAGAFYVYLRRRR